MKYPIQFNNTWQKTNISNFQLIILHNILNVKSEYKYLFS